MYICTLVEFISSRCNHIAVQLDTEVIEWKSRGFYTNATIEEKCSLKYS